MSLDERVAYLEGRVEKQTRQSDGIRDAIAHLETRMDSRFEAIDRRFEGLARRFDVMDEKFSRYFVWMLAAQVTTFAAVVTAFVAR